MSGKTIITKLISALQSTEFFARPLKQLTTGSWELYEYYTEEKGELIHTNKNQMKEGNIFCEMVFSPDSTFLQKVNIPVDLLMHKKFRCWNRRRNFIELGCTENDRDNLKFQFAVNKQTLKLLNKNTKGEILFFGFFRKKNTDSDS